MVVGGWLGVYDDGERGGGGGDSTESLIIGHDLALADEPADLVPSEFLPGLGLVHGVLLVVLALDEGVVDGHAVAPAGATHDLRLGAFFRFEAFHDRAADDGRGGFAGLDHLDAELGGPGLDALVEVLGLAEAADEEDGVDAHGGALLLAAALGDGLHLEADELDDLVDDRVEQGAHFLARDLEVAPVDARVLQGADGGHIDVEGLLARVVAEGRLGGFEVLDRLLAVDEGDIAVVVAHALGEEFFELAVDEGRAAEVAGAGGAFHDAEVGLDGLDVVRDQIDGSSAGVADHDPVVHSDLRVRVAVFETAQGEDGGAFRFGKELQVVFVAQSGAYGCILWTGISISLLMRKSLSWKSSYRSFSLRRRTKWRGRSKQSLWLSSASLPDRSAYTKSS